MSTPVCTGLLLRTRAGLAPRVSLANAFAAAELPFEVKPLFTTTSKGRGLGAAETEKTWQWHLAEPTQSLASQHAWDMAHRAFQQGLGFAGGGEVFIEPDFEQQWLGELPPPSSTAPLAATAPVCTFDDQDLGSGKKGVKDVFAWHLGPTYSQLEAARARVASGANGDRVRIVHLDTGYDPNHPTLPAGLRHDLERDFLADKPGAPAHDPGPNGHGTGTLSILAGGQHVWNTAPYNFTGVLGGAPDAEVVPVRVGRGVVQFKTSSVASGIAYAAKLAGDADPQKHVHVISMSMGGVASQAWADAVNNVYDAGIVFVAAAGNNYAVLGVPFPTRFIVYPARFHRVLAACGVMADGSPYYGLSTGTMQGNWGPDSKMDSALSAFTPNIAWAKWGCAKIVRMNGEGTSSATPQVAAAAALYYQSNFAQLAATYPQPWMRVEAVRQALLSAALPTKDAARLGRGLLRADAALQVPLPSPQSLREAEPDRALFPFLRVITGLGIADTNAQAEMLALEATQLAQRPYGDKKKNLFEALALDPDRPAGAVTQVEQQRLIQALLEHPAASPQLRRHLDRLRTGQGGNRRDLPRPAGPPPRITPPARFVAPSPPVRCLRGFAIDPSLATQYKTVAISEVTFRIPWDENLEPGPRDEYLEVVDVDPASGCLYEPVDLNDRRLLAQDGLAPSQGTPQFHQQMVYAVARLTVRNFEHALGRPALWRPHLKGKNDSRYVQRLRIYPHALRERNAYYSPDKVALLFGYFNADADAPADHVPGGRVFACLSHDIIAHETTHALLDGMHRRFLRPTNLDVHAFHEAFADLVALFQHFTFPEIVRQQISATRGEIDQHETLLAQLAGEFGRATGSRGALRYAIGRRDERGVWKTHPPDPTEYEHTTEAHARGALLVAAVFDAFIAIYQRRTRDLLRLATDGSGVLRPGALHPELVDRLARETAKAAGHVLGMCVRALDYCPPVDITFGEYLRAIITADYDLVPDDDLDYRVAFIEAFRQRGLYPRGLRTLSEESLLWRDAVGSGPSPALTEGLARLRSHADAQLYAKGREGLFVLQREMRRELHEWLKHHFASGQAGRDDAAFLGIDPALKFEVNFARFAYRVSPDGDMNPQLLVGLLQEKSVPLDPVDPKGEKMTLEGGCTIVADLRRQSIGYCIRKSIDSDARLERQRTFAATATDAMRATYFGAPDRDGPAEPFAVLHRGH